MDLVDGIKGTISAEAEELVNSVFPQKTAQLDALLQSVDFQLENLRSVKEKSRESMATAIPNDSSRPSTSEKDIGEPPTKMTKICKAGRGDDAEEDDSERGVTTNAQLSHLMSIMRPEIITLMESCNTVRTWEDTMSELKGVETESAVLLESISSYYFSRAKVASKVIKHPHIHDYVRFIEEEDEKQFVSLRHAVAELRNFYSSLHDLIIKNIEKIKRPRNSNHSSMY